MQLTTLYLYDNWIRCQLILDPLVPNRNTIVYSHPIKIYKNTDNLLKFEFRNQDRKRIHVNGYRIFLYVFKASTPTANAMVLGDSDDQAVRIQDSLRAAWDGSTLDSTLDLDDGSTLFDQYSNVSSANGYIIKKELYVLDDGSSIGSKGIATAVVTKEDLESFHSGDYYYSLKIQSPGSFESPVYTDVDFGARGTVQVLAGHYPPE